MKVKFLSAYEKEDSITIRITPQRWAKIMCKTKDDDFGVAMSELAIQKVYMSDERKAALIKNFKLFIKELKS